MAYAVLQGRDIGCIENEFPVPVGAFASVCHLRGHTGILQLQFHTHAVFPDGCQRFVKRMASFLFEVPIPVGLHPGLVDSQFLPVLITGPHVIGNPVQTLSSGMAMGGQGRSNFLPVLVLAIYIYIVGQVNLFGGDIKAGELQMLRIQGFEHFPCTVHVPVQRL